MTWSLELLACLLYSPLNLGVLQILEGSSIQFNCSFLQNMTNSVPAANSALCSGLSATYYSNWKVTLSLSLPSLLWLPMCLLSAALLCFAL